MPPDPWLRRQRKVENHKCHGKMYLYNIRHLSPHPQIQSPRPQIPCSTLSAKEIEKQNVDVSKKSRILPIPNQSVLCRQLHHTPSQVLLLRQQKPDQKPNQKPTLPQPALSVSSIFIPAITYPDSSLEKGSGTNRTTYKIKVSNPPTAFLRSRFLLCR